MEYGFSRRENEQPFALVGKLQIATAADALSVLPGFRDKVRHLREVSDPRTASGDVTSEGVEAQKARIYMHQNSDIKLSIIKGLELQLLNSTLPPQKRVAAYALWEIMADSLRTTV